jgi:RNA polymerase sigma-70 factor (ECF subfamily)
VLFADGGKVLRAWDPERGVSLKGFVGVVATRRAVSMVRTSKRNPWTEDPTDSADLDLIQSSRRDADRAVIAKEILSKGMAAVRGDLSERGQQLFDLIIVEDASNEEVAEATGLSRDAIYQWRSRLMKALRQQLRKIDPSSP